MRMRQEAILSILSTNITTARMRQLPKHNHHAHTSATTRMRQDAIFSVLEPRHVSTQTHGGEKLLHRGQNNRLTCVKTLPLRNYVAGGNDNRPISVHYSHRHHLAQY